jgi:ribosome-associated toxin RatA of RatAB toxin-antitoxin module
VAIEPTRINSPINLRRNKVPIIEASIDIALPRDEVYQISQDYSVRYDWDPFPDSMKMIGDGENSARIGGQVFIRSKLGMEMVVEFVQVKPPKNAAIKMVSGPWYLAKFAGSWIFDTINEEQTRVRFRYVLQTRCGIFNYLIETISVSYFRHVTNKRLLRLRNFCESKSI